MECKCGGSSSSATVSNKVAGLKMEYQVCQGCGRVGDERVYALDTGELLGYGAEGRKAYNILVGDVVRL